MTAEKDQAQTLSWATGRLNDRSILVQTTLPTTLDRESMEVNQPIVSTVFSSVFHRGTPWHQSRRALMQAFWFRRRRRLEAIGFVPRSGCKTSKTEIKYPKILATPCAAPAQVTGPKGSHGKARDTT